MRGQWVPGGWGSSSYLGRSSLANSFPTTELDDVCLTQRPSRGQGGGEVDLF